MHLDAPGWNSEKHFPGKRAVVSFSRASLVVNFLQKRVSEPRRRKDQYGHTGWPHTTYNDVEDQYQRAEHAPVTGPILA
jgi:hypothetical protein